MVALSPNHLIAHVDADEQWIAKVLDVEGNDLKVRISSDTGGVWFETWNLAHTEAGLNQKIYYIIGKCHG